MIEWTTSLFDLDFWLRLLLSQS